MSVRSFASGFLAGLVTPAVIVLVIIAFHSPAAPTPAPTPIPELTATQATVATRTPLPPPTLTPATTRTPAPTGTSAPAPSPTSGAYQVETIEVPSRQTAYVVFKLPERYVLEGYFEVGGGDNSITFWAVGRGGNTAINKQDVVGRAEFRLSAKQSDSYTLYFDNGRSAATAKQVTIYYRLRAD